MILSYFSEANFKLHCISESTQINSLDIIVNKCFKCSLTLVYRCRLMTYFVSEHLLNILVKVSCEVLKIYNCIKEPLQLRWEGEEKQKKKN